MAVALGMLLTGSAQPPEAPSRADGGHPYIFTQQHRGALWWWHGTWKPQTVEPGARLQTQLPGDPTRWNPEDSPDCQPTGDAKDLPLRASITHTGFSKLPNKGRIKGARSLYVFDYRVSGRGVISICMSPDPEVPEGIGCPRATTS